MATGSPIAGWTSPGGNGPYGLAISTVPEPASAALLGLGACLLAAHRRRNG